MIAAARGATGGFVTSGCFTNDAKLFTQGRNLQLLEDPRLLAMVRQARKAGAEPEGTVIPTPKAVNIRSTLAGRSGVAPHCRPAAACAGWSELPALVAQFGGVHAYKMGQCKAVQQSATAPTASMMMKPSTLFAICKKTAMAWVDDYAPSMGAAISYYTAFSIAPLLVIVIAIAGYFFGEEAVRGALQGQISGLVGSDGAAAIQGLVSSARAPAEGVVASGISLAILVVGATTVFAEIQSALDRIWHVPEKAKPSGLWGLLRARFLSFGLILGLAFLLIASLAVSAAVAAMGSWFSRLLPSWEIVLQGLNIALSVVVETLLFAMIFKLMPSTRIAWSDVWVGAAVTAALFELGKVLIGLYVGKAGISSTYAAAGSIAIILIWVYYAAQIFLLGAEFTKVYATEYGSHRREVPTESPETPVRSEDPQPVATHPGPMYPPSAAGSKAAQGRHEGPAAGDLALGVAAMVVLGGLLAGREALEAWLTRRRQRAAAADRRGA